MERNKDFDVVLTGARCAGAATAMLLAGAGARVLVVERDAPGTDTLSTHALMRGAVMLLARWGLVGRLVATGTPAVQSTTFAYPGERTEIAIKPGQGVESLLAPRRTVLDPLLAEAAVAAGAQIRYRTALTRLEVGRGGRVVGARIAGPGGQETVVRAGLVIGADGRRSSLARMVGAATTAAGEHAAAAAYGYVPGLPDLGYRWLYGPGIAGGAIPTNDGLHVVFVALPPDRYAREMRPDLGAGLVRGLAALDPELAVAVALHGFVGRPVGFAGTPGYLRRSHGPGWALVGDAGYFKDPITSHGITDALRDADLLARAVLAGNQAALADYEATRDALSLPFFRLTDAIAALPDDMDRLRELHRELSAAMKAEQAWIAETSGELAAEVAA